MNAPRGWYADSTRPNTERYWDGRGWTDQTRFPGVTPFASPVPSALPEPEVAPDEVVSMFERSTVGYSLPPDLSAIRDGAQAPPAQTRPPHRPVVVKTLSLLLAMVLVGGGIFLAFGRHSDAGAAVADAVNSALASHSADLTISGSGDSVDGNFTISGTGAIDFAQPALQMSVQIASGSESVNEQVIELDNEMYMSLGNLVGQILPGKSWISLDLGQLTQGGARQSLGTGGSSLTNDPAAALQALSQNGDTVTDLGSSSINGVDVEGYSVHLDSGTLKREIAQGQLPSWMQQAASSISSPNIAYRVYVNGSGQLVRMTTDVTETVGGQSVNAGINMDFSDYGATVNVTAPPANEVGTLQSFLQAAASLSGSSISTN
jgi:hypothetical protein